MPDKYDERCDLEVLCHYHHISVPKNRAAALWPISYPEEADMFCLDLLEEEIWQMERRLQRYHKAQRAMLSGRHIQEQLINIYNDSTLASDNDISDYTNSGYDYFSECIYENDGEEYEPNISNYNEEYVDSDTQRSYLPKCLVRNGKPYCCTSTRFDLSV